MEITDNSVVVVVFSFAAIDLIRFYLRDTSTNRFIYSTSRNLDFFFLVGSNYHLAKSFT